MAYVMTMNGLYDTDKKAFVDSIEAVKPPVTERKTDDAVSTPTTKKKPRKTARK